MEIMNFFLFLKVTKVLYCNVDGQLKESKTLKNVFEWLIPFIFVSRIFSCSVDCDASVWDLTTGSRIKRLSGHEEIVNTCAAAKRDHPNLLVTGSDDGNTMVNMLVCFLIKTARID
jgi:WD40 repeat protein